jgi:hypothetical protein
MVYLINGNLINLFICLQHQIIIVKGIYQILCNSSHFLCSKILFYVGDIEVEGWNLLGN